MPSADPGRQHIRERQRALFYEGLPRPLFGLMGLNLCMSELPLQGASHGWRFYSAVAAVADEGGLSAVPIQEFEEPLDIAVTLADHRDEFRTHFVHEPNTVDLDIIHTIA